MVKDSYGRTIAYLRLSVTDRCNLRCRYCRPQREFHWLPHEEILSIEELIRITRAFAEIGVKKVRLTGGEPLVRRGLLVLARAIAEMPEVRELCLTTNGLLLEEMAPQLLRAGITHLNVSLDTLDEGRFLAITGHGGLHKVLAGIDRAVELGFQPVKINAVVMRGINLDEVPRLAALTLDRPLEIRFIEFMPVGHDTSWNRERMVEIPEIKAILTREFGRLLPVESDPLAGPAKCFQIAGASGRVGFISPMSSHFCGDCNRVRVTADGRLRLCLFSDDEVDLKEALRGEELSHEELKVFLRRAIGLKPMGLDGLNDQGGKGMGCRRIMSTIGG